MKKRHSERSLQPEAIKETANERLKRGLDMVLDNSGSIYIPTDLNEENKELYRETLHLMRRAYNIREILGGDLSAESAANKFVELAEIIVNAKNSQDTKTREEAEEKLTLIFSIFKDRKRDKEEGSGISAALSAASGYTTSERNKDLFDFLVNEIRTSKLPTNYQFIIDYMKEKNRI